MRALVIAVLLIFPRALMAQLQLPDLTENATGYVENPIIGNQVRIRFDAGFDDRFPDRAEFFYGKCGCFRILGLDPEAPGPGPGIVTSLRFQEYTGDFEYALKPRFSVLATIPFRAIQPTDFVPAGGPEVFPNHFGFGDLRLGLKAAIYADENHYVSFQFKSYLPTGNAEDGLGTDHVSLEPAVLVNRKINDRAALSGQAGFWIPIHGSSRAPLDDGRYAGNIFSYGFALSYGLSGMDAPVRVTPVVEFMGWNVMSGSATTTTGIADASGTNIFNIKAGVRLAFRTTDSIYTGYGHQLTNAGWYNDMLRLEYRHAF